MTGSSSRRRRFARGIAIGGVSLAVFIGVLEVLTRTVLDRPEFHPELLQPAAGAEFAPMLEPWNRDGLAYRGRPGARVSIFGIEYRHDSLGLRGPERAAKQEDTTRVLVLGDSNVYGWRVAEDETFCAIAERLVNDRLAALGADRATRRCEIVNAGLPGYNSRDERARYATLKEVLRPDVVLLAWFGNDCERFGFQVDARGFLYFDPLPVPASWKPLLWRSYAWRLLVSRKSRALTLAKELEPVRPANVAFSMNELRGLAAEVANDGRPFALLHIPFLESDGPSQRITRAGYRDGGRSRELELLSTGLHVPYLDFLSAIEGEPVALLWASMESGDHHPSVKAHAAFGAALAEFLLAQKLL